MSTRTATDPTHATAPGAPGPALRDHVLDELGTAQAALGEHGDALHEGVHRARKALRRARAVLALGDGILGPGAALIDRELRGLNTGLSSLRDAHALVETLERLLYGRRARNARPLLLDAHAAAVAARALCTEAELDRDPELGRRRAMIAVLVAALPALAWSRLTPSALRIAVADSDARMQAARTRALDSGRDEDWHRWRRRARRASQQRHALDAIGLAVAASADGSAGQAFEGHVFDKRNTERLGEAQDLSLLLDHCGRDSPFSSEQRRALRRYARPALARLRKRIAQAADERPSSHERAPLSKA